MLWGLLLITPGPVNPGAIPGRGYVGVGAVMLPPGDIIASLLEELVSE